MKLKVSDYIKGLFSIFIGRPTKDAATELRYVAELGGKNGYKVNGIKGYWGRYASIDKIVELASTLSKSEDWFSFYFPAPQYDFKYSHKIFIGYSDEPQTIELGFNESSDQHGCFLKTIKLNALASEIENMNDICLSLEEYGYIYEENEY